MVVGAELDQREIRFVGQLPVERRKAAGTGLATDRAVDDARLDVTGFERAFELRGETVPRRQAEAGGEAVADRQDPDRCGDGAQAAEQ